MRTSDAGLREVLEEVGQLGTVRREMAKCTAPNLQAGAAGVLWQVAASGPFRMSDLAYELRLDVSVISRQVSELVAAGYLDRRPDPTDGRACLLSLTGAGRNAIDAVMARVLDRARPLQSEWTADDLQRLALELRRLRHDVLLALTSDDELQTTT